MGKEEHNFVAPESIEAERRHLQASKVSDLRQAAIVADCSSEACAALLVQGDEDKTRSND